MLFIACCFCANVLSHSNLNVQKNCHIASVHGLNCLQKHVPDLLLLKTVN
jgi:hypothetical protein